MTASINSFFNLSDANNMHNPTVLEKLGKVIIDNNLEKFLGVSLLHKHFDIPPGAKLTRRKLDQNTIRVEITSKNKETIPCHWSFYPNNKWDSVEFIDSSTWRVNNEKLAKIALNNKKFLRDFQECLIKYSCEKIYGIMTLHAFDMLDINPLVDCLNESSDNFSSTIKTKDKFYQNLEGNDIPALWVFQKNKEKQMISHVCYNCGDCVVQEAT